MKVFYCIEALLDKSAFRLKQFIFSSIGNYVYNLMQRKQKLQQVLLLMHS